MRRRFRHRAAGFRADHLRRHRPARIRAAGRLQAVQRLRPVRLCAGQQAHLQQQWRQGRWQRCPDHRRAVEVRALLDAGIASGDRPGVGGDRPRDQRAQRQRGDAGERPRRSADGLCGLVQADRRIDAGLAVLPADSGRQRRSQRQELEEPDELPVGRAPAGRLRLDSRRGRRHPGQAQRRVASGQQLPHQPAPRLAREFAARTLRGGGLRKRAIARQRGEQPRDRSRRRDDVPHLRQPVDLAALFGQRQRAQPRCEQQRQPQVRLRLGRGAR